MKKLKSNANMSLSHVQIEAIMYNSLNALLSMSNVKNELAMLNAIIKNKINDAVTPVVNRNARTEYVPEWFENRNNDALVSCAQKTDSDFEVMRAAILGKR